MKVFILWRYCGKVWKNAIKRDLPYLKKIKIRFCFVNGENAANGFGITKKICEEFYL